VDGNTHKLPQHFMVLATENPIEYEGTFPLPEAQLDRFLMRIKIGYPSLVDEVRVLEIQQLRHPIEDLSSVVTSEELLEVQNAVKTVYVSAGVKRYIVELTRATRDSSDVYLGASPRGSLGLFRTSQAKAALEDRDFVLPDDVKAIAEFVLAHRTMVSPAARLRDITPAQVIAGILSKVPIPGGDSNRKTDI
jgi:MoxR-like ATPase